MRIRLRASALRWRITRSFLLRRLLILMIATAGLVFGKEAAQGQLVR